MLFKINCIICRNSMQAIGRRILVAMKQWELVELIV